MRSDVIDISALPSRGLQNLRLFERISLGLYCVALMTSMSGMEIFGALLALLTLADLCLSPKVRSLPPLTLPILVFSVVLVAGVFLGDAAMEEKWRDISRLRFFLLYFAFYYQLSHAGASLGWLRVLLGVGFLIGIYGVFQHMMPLDLVRPEGKKIFRFAVESQKVGPLVIGTFNHHLTFSNIFLMHACLFVSLGLSRVRYHLAYLGVGLLLMLACFWTQSRVAWVAIPLCLFAVFLQKGMKTAFAVLAIFLGLLVFFYQSDAGFRGRFERTFLMEDADYNGGPRKRLWAAQVEMFKAHPILGLGYNNNERHAKEYVDRLFPHRDNFYGHAHSTPLQLLSSTGVLGVMAYLFLWAMLFVHCGRLVRSPRGSLLAALGWGLIAAFLGFHIQGLTQWNFGDAEVLHNLVFFWALTTALTFKMRHSPEALL